MRKDPTEFRKRFAAWKNGEKVYKDGLPAYKDGTGKINWDNVLSTSYRIPYIPEKAVTLTDAGLATGAHLSTNLLDSIADNAERARLPLQTALGIATKESTLGNPTDDRTAWNLSSDIRRRFNNVYPGTVQHINKGQSVDPLGLVNYYKGDIDFGYRNFPQGDGIVNETKPVHNPSLLTTAFLFYKLHPDKYNPGQKNYQRLVEKRGKEVMGSPEIKQWLKERNIKKTVGRFARVNPLLKESKFNPQFNDGKLPGYKDGKPVVLNNYTNAKFNDDGTFTDDTTRVFDDFYVTPSGVKTKYGSYTDKNWDRYKQQEAFFRTHDQQTGNLKYEPGLEIVSPEYDILTLGAGARTNAATQTFLKNRKIANAIAKGIKNNPVLKVYNSNPSYLDTGGNVLQYLDYINSLFPNSKIKDIVYHSTWAKPFEQFDPSKIKRGYGFYFSPSENHLPFDRMVYSRVNILNPLEIFPNKNRNLDVSGLWRKDLTELAIRNGLHDGVVGVSNMRNPGEPEIVALNPDQIHILGSNKDLAGFKQFVNYPNGYKKSLNDANNIFDIAKEPYIKTSADIAKESSTIRELNRVNEMLRKFSDDDSRISNAYNNIKTFLQSPEYKKRLEKYYRDKGSSIITQNVAPEDRIGEQLYNIETSKLKLMPKGKLIDEVGNVKDSFGLYDPNSHSIQIASDAIFRLTPEHEMWHAARKAMPYLDNAKYKMRVRSLSDPIYYGDMAELEVRVLDTLREMQEAGLDINNLTDDQIWNFLKDSPIDTHGTNVQSLIDNYWYDDIKNALRNFKTVIYPLGFGGVGYGSYNKYAE